MYQQRIEEKQRELEDAQIMQRVARKAALDAEGRVCVSGSELVQLQTDLTRAEENVFWVSAELDALNELQAEHLEAARAYGSQQTAPGAPAKC